MNALVSIVVAMYNSADFLERTLERLISQTYCPIEVLLVDDGSTDGTFSIAMRAAAVHGNISCYRKINEGVAEARNFGIMKAKGEFIAFCDHDDLWAENKLEEQMILFGNEGIGLVYSQVRIMNDKGALISSERPSVPFEGNVFERLLLGNFIPFSSVVVRRSCLDDVGMFYKGREMHGSDDRNLVTRIAKKYLIKCYHGVLVDIIKHGSNYSFQEQKMLLAGRHCLDDLWGRFGDVKKINPKLYKRSYLELYLHYGKNMFSRDDLKGARYCLLMAARYAPTRIEIYRYLCATFLPIDLINMIRALRRIYGISVEVSSHDR